MSLCGGERMTDKKEIVSAAPQPTAVSFPNATQGMINTGSGIQVGTNAGTMNLNINSIIFQEVMI